MATKVNRRKTHIKSSEGEDGATPPKILSERARRSLSRSKSRENINSTNDDTDTSPQQVTIGRKKRSKTPLKNDENEARATPSKILSERARRSLSRSKSRENINSTNDDTDTSPQQASTRRVKRRTTSLKSSEDEDRKTPSKILSERERRSFSRSKCRENIHGAEDVALIPKVILTKLKTDRVWTRKTPSKNNENEDPETPSKPKNRKKASAKTSADEDDSKTPSKSKRQRKTPIKRSPKTPSKELSERANDGTPSPPVTTTRRSTRISLRQSKRKTIGNSVDDETVDDQSDGGWADDIPPKNFFNENPDDHVHCHSFKTPKKRDGMVLLAHNTPKRITELKLVGTPKTPKTPRTPKGLATPRTPKTPKSSRKIIEPKTPSNLRAKLQNGVRKRCKEVEDEDDYSEFEDSGDDFQPDSESSDSDIDLEAANSSSSEDEPNQVKPIVKPAQKILSKRTTTRFSSRKCQDYAFESDKYFGHTNRKNATSDNTLDSLKTPRLQHEDMFKLLASHEISESHQNCIRDLQSHYETFFPKWMFILREGFNILLHGLGSKRNILETLHRRVLSDEDVLVVNGYFPSLTVKDILDDIVILLETSCKSKNLHEIVDAIEGEMKQTPDYHIFLIINNLDGTMLRNDMAQNILSRLAHIPNIHLIASIDHINAPNLWDNIQLSNYNFSWWDVTSFLPYTDETSVAENSMLLKNSGALTIASMKSVLLSLTQNARGIYMLIVENQLASNKTSNYQGMPFKNLYKKCLEAFLVSSDIVLRTQLTEFCDHNLLKLKRTADGTEQLKIPIDNVLLQQFVEQYSNWQLEN